MRSSPLKRTALGVLALVALMLVAASLLLSASLPRRGGEVGLDGLDASVDIELDAHAVPRIRARSLADAYRALGFLHAQERFFQMDLTRRSQAGELAAWFGERALPLDRSQRRFDFRARSRALAARLPERHRAWLEAYVEGVNAGLADLRARPPEYWLFAAPEPWTVEDSLLSVYAFYTMLSNNESYERAQAVMRATLPAEVYDFLTPTATRFDRPLVANSDDLTAGYRPKAIPDAASIDLRSRSAPDPARQHVDPPLAGPASNQWAADARRGARGQAVLANDPHLRLRLPNVFYRVELEWPGGVARGVSIPGLPGIVLGATDTVAWGATVSNADQSDWVIIEIDGEDADRYRVPGGSEPFRTKVHEIAVRGRDAPERLEVLETRFGPVVDRDWLGRPLALRATWLEHDGTDLEILELPFAADVEEAVAVLAAWSGPSLNWLVADRDGDIAWVVNGPLPRRVGFDGSSPESWAAGATRWSGWQEPPRLFGGDRGTLYTANNRTLPLEQAMRLSRMWMRPTRAQRIAELLAEGERFDEHDFFTMQLDTQARAYEQIRNIVLEIVPDDEPDPMLGRARRLVADWNGRADVAERGFRVLHVYYLALLERALAPLLAPAIDADPELVYRWPLADEPLRRLLEARPTHLLTAEYASWTAFLRQVFSDTLTRLGRDGAAPLDAAWGEVNRLAVTHPFAALPLVGRWLRLPEHLQPGSMVSLRVAAPDYGAVIRMAVSPAAPERGILQMAGGQSGHFLSRNFADLHEDWSAGRPTPFLAGPATHQFRLRPRQP